MSRYHNPSAEYIAEVIDIQGPWRWLVRLGVGRQFVATVLPSAQGRMERLAPGDFVLIRFRSAKRTPRIVGYSDVDRSGRPVAAK
jgi:hypothetical protein